MLNTKSTKDDDYEDEVSDIQKYKQARELCLIKLEKVLVVPIPSSTSHSSNDDGHSPSNQKRNFKLPKIEIKKFNGDLCEWLGFWSQFEKIHEDKTLHDSDKFQYLVQAMIPGTRAKRLVDSYPQSTANYPKVISALKERFGDKVLLGEVYIRKLINTVITNATSPEKQKDLAGLYDTLETHLRSLESLGISAEEEAAAMFLHPLIESSLPLEIVKVWQRSPHSGYEDDDEKPVVERFRALLKFLKNEVKGQERLSFVSQGLEDLSISKEKRQRSIAPRTKQLEDVPTAAGLYNGQGQNCVFCDKSHESELCRSAGKLTLSQKKEKVRKSGRCFQCLRRGHISNKCQAYIKCVICEKKHLAIMCPTKDSPQSQDSKEKDSTTTVATNLNSCSEVLLKTLSARVVGEGGRTHIARILIDDGSQRSYIKKSTVSLLKLKTTGRVTQRKTLFGGALTDIVDHNKYEVTICGVRGNNSRKVTLLDEKNLTGEIPRIPHGPWMDELKKRRIWLSDLNCKNPDIEILLGSDFIPQIVTGSTTMIRGGLLATETVFGWMLQGTVETTRDSIAMTTICTHVQEIDLPALWALEPLGIKDPIEVKTEEEQDQKAKELFCRSVKQEIDGRYTVGLPWSEGIQDIPSNKEVAEKRLISATRKLEKEGRFDDYNKMFDSWLEEGIIEEVTEDSEGKCHYLPHRPVFKESLTTPVRPVFDASCKIGRYPSLNDCLYKGPNLLELIPAVLTRFRSNNYGVIADIRKAFQMISVNHSDRDFIRFLWWRDNSKKEIRIFRHARVVFGLNSSPFLLAATIEHHLRKVDEGLRITATKLLKSLYVDNVVTSVRDHEEYEDFRGQATSIMADAKMELRVWEVTARDAGGAGPLGSSGCGLNAAGIEDSSEPITQVLGLKWNKISDTLSCTVPQPPTEITKRSVLSQISKIFDPIGFTGPALLRPKILLQQSWAEKYKWDEELPEEMADEFRKWNEELRSLESINLPRQAIHSNYSAGLKQQIEPDPVDKDLSKSLELHTFVDASQEAYAAVVFARTVTKYGVVVELLQARNRVAPLKMTEIQKSQSQKKATIPRLELMACLIGARLHKSVVEALEGNDVKSYFWTDSTTALAWIRRNDVWGTFVGNRVKEILTLTATDEWSHVPGVHNPADLPSRGCSPKELLQSKWWEGPEWLKSPRECWPAGEQHFNEEEISLEKRKSTLVNLNKTEAIADPVFSTYSKNLRVYAWVRRFLQNLKKREEDRIKSQFLTISEIRETEPWLIRIIQDDAIDGEITEVGGVQVEKKDGLYRAVTRLTFGTDGEDFKMPVLLPKSHPLVRQLIMEMHLNYSHAGVQFLMGKIRNKYWIPQSRRTIRKVLRTCVRCRRHEAKSLEVDSSALPVKRITTGEAFQVTGVDLMGPVILRDGTKAWGVLYTCSTYRCVHLDVVTSLSAEAFLMSLERFINCQGRPNDIFSDNGTNFVGAANLMKRVNWQEMEKQFKIKRISWTFNPPTAAWWGGWWERLVGSTKKLLRRVLGVAKVNYDEFRTCLAAVSHTINDRPLTTVSEDPDDLLPLTPSMFLRGLPMSGFPEGEKLSGKGLQKQYRRMQDVKRQLQSRFKTEYLSLLVQKAQKKKNRHQLRIGDVVLIGADNMKRVLWPLGRITDLMPGKDGVIRVARLKTKHGPLLRPLQRLFPLEVEQGDIPNPNPETVKKSRVEAENRVQEELEESIQEVDQDVVVKTRAGRVVKKPHRLGEC